VTTSFLDTLLDDFVRWAADISDCRALILFGSTARGEGDAYSDHDIQVVAANRDNEQYIAWMREYAPLWVNVREHNVSTPLWALMYRGGHKVHLSVIGIDDLQKVIDSGSLNMDYQRGYKILLDKDGLAIQLPASQPPTHTPPSESEFTEGVQNVIYGTCMIAKYLRRGSLWTVQWANGVERNFLLRLIEWHARATNPGVDTWHRGEHMQEWVDAGVWQALQSIAGRFDAGDSWRALFALLDVIQKLAKETATALDYPYPQEMIAEVAAYLHELHSAGK
jgi:aminoglycoside 6-adenylyltransferase